jgi:hypothetical protein
MKLATWGYPSGGFVKAPTDNELEGMDSMAIGVDILNRSLCMKFAPPIYHIQKLDEILETEQNLAEMARFFLKYQSDSWRVWVAVGFDDFDYCEALYDPLSHLPFLRRQVVKVSILKENSYYGAFY